MINADRALRDALQKYMNSNNYHPDKLKHQLIKRAYDPENMLIKKGLEAALEGTIVITPLAFEGLTNSLSDTQEEVNEWMLMLWNYIYNNGPNPDQEEDSADIIG